MAAASEMDAAPGTRRTSRRLKLGGAALVNDRVVAHLKPKTRQGEAMVPGPIGTIPPGCIYAGSPHKDGFDSRYAAIGFICRDRLIGVGTPIL